MPEHVWSSDLQEVVDGWHHLQDSHKAWHERLNELEPPIPGGVLVVLSRHGQKRAHGWDFTERPRPDAPDGWRYDKNLYLVPRKSTKVGKAAAAILGEHQWYAEPLPGMPMSTIVNMHWCNGSLELIDGVIWAGWSQDVSDYVDHDIWERRPLSAYYLAKEAIDA